MRFLAHQLLINPAFWILGFILLTAWHSRRERIWITVTGLFLAFFFFKPPIEYLIHKRERKHGVFDWQEGQRGLPILVLGSGGTPDPELSPTHWLTQGSLPRVVEGVRLWQGSRESLLIMSSAGKEGYLSQARIYSMAAMELGVPDSLLRAVDTPKTTWEEARDFSAAFPGEEELVLVTSASHMPRALRIFEQFGLQPLPAPCDFSIKVHPSGEHSPSRYFPSLGALRLWGKLLHEWAGEVTMGF